MSIFSRFPIDTEKLKALLEVGVRQGGFKDVELPVLFIMLMHGGGAVMYMGPLGRYIGLKSSRSEKELRQQAGVIVDTLLNGLVVKHGLG
jgi:hypothetical protein